jgi:hypothetical protein
MNVACHWPFFVMFFDLSPCHVVSVAKYHDQFKRDNKRRFCQDDLRTA